jgi:hypothetical protein
MQHTVPATTPRGPRWRFSAWSAIWALLLALPALKLHFPTAGWSGYILFAALLAALFLMAPRPPRAASRRPRLGDAAFVVGMVGLIGTILYLEYDGDLVIPVLDFFLPFFVNPFFLFFLWLTLVAQKWRSLHPRP